jgi:uncharacterized protein YkwD
MGSRIRQRLICLAIGLLLLAGCGGTDQQATATPAPPDAAETLPPAEDLPATPQPAPPTDNGDEAELAEQAANVIALVNQERAAAGCPELTPNDTLTAAAEAHSQDMAENHFLDHTGSEGSTPAERAEAAGYQWQRVAENVAAGPPSADIAVDGWMDSPGHRENILDCELRETGVGVVEAPDDPTYGIYWTQLFGTPR